MSIQINSLLIRPLLTKKPFPVVSSTDVKQFEMTMAKLEMVFKNQIVLERDVQLAKQTISQGMSSSTVSSQLRVFLLLSQIKLCVFYVM
jgi:hypothetical protein